MNLARNWRSLGRFTSALERSKRPPVSTVSKTRLGNFEISTRPDPLSLFLSQVRTPCKMQIQGTRWEIKQKNRWHSTRRTGASTCRSSFFFPFFFLSADNPVSILPLTGRFGSVDVNRTRTFSILRFFFLSLFLFRGGGERGSFHPGGTLIPLYFGPSHRINPRNIHFFGRRPWPFSSRRGVAHFSAAAN